MDECWDPIVSVAIPLTIINLIGTTLIILLWDCAKNTLDYKSKTSEIYSEHSSISQSSLNNHSYNSTHNPEYPEYPEYNNSDIIDDSNHIEHDEHELNITENFKSPISDSKDSKHELNISENFKSPINDSKDNKQEINITEKSQVSIEDVIVANISNSYDKRFRSPINNTKYNDDSLDEISKDEVKIISTSDKNNEIISDDDLIAHIRESSILSIANNDVSPDNNRKPDDIIIEDSTAKPHILITRNELSGDQASLESMAGTLISVTKKIAGTLDNATHIPSERKQELASLLKGVPGFITKIVDMNDAELETILKGASSKSSLSYKTNVSEDHKKESEFLMKTLEALRKK
jgi:hypothetical protein